METFTVDNLPDDGWQEFRRKTPTRMFRVAGPFTVETSDGRVHCENGWVAVDARGYPYPIADDEQASAYEAV